MNYEIRYADELNKLPFLNPNAAKLFSISTIFKEGASWCRLIYPLPQYT
jgi:hypothetical protein